MEKGLEINVDAYIQNYAQNNKDYIKDSLQSNRNHLAKLLQYIYVCNPAEYKPKADLMNEVDNLLKYTKAIIIKPIPKYTKEYWMPNIYKDLENKIIIAPDDFDIIPPETFGGIDYADYVKNKLDGAIKQNETKYFYYRTNNEYNIAVKVIKFMEDNNIKNVDKLLELVKKKVDK